MHLSLKKSNPYYNIKRLFLQCKIVFFIDKQGLILVIKDIRK